MSVAFERVLLPYDASEAASVALGYAVNLAERGAQLTMINVVDRMQAYTQSGMAMEYGGDPTTLVGTLDDEGGLELAAAALRCAEAGVHSTTRLIHDRVVPGIVSAAQDTDAQLIIMGTHAREGLARAWLGSTTEGVLRSCNVPVLVVRGKTRTMGSAQPFHRAIVAYDGSVRAEATLMVALQLAQTTATRLVLCYVVESRALRETAMIYGNDLARAIAELHRAGRELLDDALARIEASHEHADTMIFEGEPVSAILEAARSCGADLILTGSHGRSGLSRFLLGSVAEAIARQSELPVLIVRS